MTDIKKQARKFLAWRAKQAKDVYDEMTAEPKTDDLVRRYDCGKTMHNHMLVPSEVHLRCKAQSSDARMMKAARYGAVTPRLTFRSGW